MQVKIRCDMRSVCRLACAQSLQTRWSSARRHRESVSYHNLHTFVRLHVCLYTCLLLLVPSCRFAFSSFVSGCACLSWSVGWSCAQAQKDCVPLLCNTCMSLCCICVLQLVCEKGPVRGRDRGPARAVQAMSHQRLTVQYTRSKL